MTERLIVRRGYYMELLTFENKCYSLSPKLNVPSGKVANLCFGQRRYVCIYKPHFVFVLKDAANELLVSSAD